MVTSYANRTAPVLRGAWILENIIGTPPAAPPPDVEGFPENKDGEKARRCARSWSSTARKPSCNVCHGVMDPLGFALENFDAIGEWRDRGSLGRARRSTRRASSSTARRSSGPADLRKALLRRPEQFVQTMTEKLMTYALGRSVEYYDMPAVRQIVRDAARDNYRFSSIVMGIVKSAPFQMRKAPSRLKPTWTAEDVAMFITKKHLSRRTFLRGAGVAVGLPLLDAMIPALTALAQTAAAPKPRMGFIYLPHGAIMEQWTPAAEGAGFELTPILKPLAPFQKQLTIVSGLENKPAIAPPVHALNPGTWLSCVTPRATQEPYGGVTIDQIAAAHIGQDTPLPSLEVATEGRGGGGACDRELRLQLRRHDLVPHADDAAADGSRSAQAVRAAVRPGRHAAGAQGDRAGSTRASSTWCRARPPTCSRRSTRPTARRLGDYLESVREIERRVQKMEAQDLSSARPAGRAGRHARSTSA